METSSGLGSSIAGSLLLGFLFAWFAKTHMWAAIGLLGLIGGWFLGELIYLFILGVADWQNLPGYISISGVCVLIVGFTSCKYSKQMIVLTTSGVGSYLFIRGFSFFFGGYPNEGDLIADLAQEIPVELGNRFWIYFGCFFFCWLLSAVY